MSRVLLFVDCAEATQRMWSKLMKHPMIVVSIVNWEELQSMRWAKLNEKGFS